MARPTKYKAEFVEQGEKLALLGLTDVQIGEFFEVDVSTIERWKLRHPAFCGALKAGKVIADGAVSRSLYQRAMGWEHQATKIFMVEEIERRHENGELIETITKRERYVPYIERFPPDSTAMIFWLKNRRPDLWRDRHEVYNRNEQQNDGQPRMTSLQLAREIAYMLHLGLKEQERARKAPKSQPPGSQPSGASGDTPTKH